MRAFAEKCNGIVEGSADERYRLAVVGSAEFCVEGLAIGVDAVMEEFYAVAIGDRRVSW